MKAVWFRIVVELRSRWRAHLAVVLLIGLGGSLALGAFAGARRTESAYPRFLDARNALDFGTATGPFNERLGLGNVDLEDVRAMPQVTRTEVITYLLAGLFTTDGEMLRAPGSLATFAADPDRDVEQVVAIDGRLPATDSMDEIAVGFEIAREMGLEVGDEIVHVVASPDALGPEAFGQGEPATADRMTVVGIAAFPGSFPPNPRYAQYIVSPAYVERWRGEAAYTDAIYIDAKPGITDGEFKAALDRIGGGRQFYFSERDEAADVQRSIDIEAGALRVFAIIVAVTAWLIVGQALARLLLNDRSEYATLRALGMTPWQRRGVVTGRVALVGALGAVAAVAGGWALSPVMPLGLARIAEPSPGFSFDAFALGIGAVIVIAAVALASVPGMLRLTMRREASPTLDRPSLIARVASRLGFAPVPATGIRMAVEQGHGTSATPVRTVVVGVAVAVAALVAAVNVGGSVARLLETPRLYGWDYDAIYGSPYSPGIDRVIRPALEADDSVAAYASGTSLARVSVEAGDKRIPLGVQAYDLVRGVVHPPVVDGRWPQDLDEIALGSRAMRRLNVSIGDRVDVDGGARSATMEVVGRAVFPSFGDPNVAELGEAVGMTFQAYERLAPGVQATVFLVRFAVGADRNIALADLRETLGDLGGFEPQRPGDLDGIARVDGLPIILATTLALLAAATLVHALVTTIRRRRRDIAILSTLGFVGRQVRGVVVWQALTLTSIAVALGVPLGIAGGRWLWRMVADRIGFVADPVTGVTQAAIVAGGTLLLAAVVSFLPARRAVRLRPAAALRTE